jgi:peptidoglycan/LPS O-acetylase OafA/YrhL
LPHHVLLVLKSLIFGHFAVDVFIILSGYCLMLPVARSKDRRLRGGSGEYLRRRALRILPPYYAALLVTLLIIKLAPPLQVRNGTIWDGCLPAFRTDVLLSHLFLVHNLLDEWKYKISLALWSVATEWQIYFFFPLLLLPLWRRFGLAITVIVAMALGLAPHFLLPDAWNLDAAVPWYLGLFAMGMGAAVINFARDEQSVMLRTRIPWGKLAAAQFFLTLATAVFRAKWWWAHFWFADAQVGLFAASLLIYCTQQSQGNRQKGLLRLLQAPPLVLLGTMSYSLYLMHVPFLALLHIPLSHLNVSPSMRIAIMIFGFVPVAVILTYAFHLVFERRFMSGYTSKARTVDPSKAAAPIG